jgi:hypothetical protein
MTYLELLTLAALLSGHEDPGKLPKIKRIETCKLLSSFENKAYSKAQCAKRLASPEPSVIAMYVHDNNTVYLRKGWGLGSVRERSIIVHEFVHYLQALNGKHIGNTSRCALETEAYGAQNVYYILNGVPTIPDAHIHNAGQCPAK